MRTCIILPIILALVGCTAATEKPSPMQPIVQPASYQEAPPTYANPGSLFSESDAQYLYSDNRARRVGDLVMVNIVENATGTNQANTKTDRTSNTDYTVGSLFGMTTMPIVGGAIGNNPLLSTKTEKKFDGKGETTRKNNVTATIAARVLRVLPDGLMEIEGARETRVNNETQYLVVTGLVRARDVAPDNSVMSTQMANAQIQYYGQGVISDKQKPGWFTRLMDNVWPF